MKYEPPGVYSTTSFRSSSGLIAPPFLHPPPPTAPAASVRTLFDVLNKADTVKIAFLGVMIGTASLLARRTRVFRRWLATGGLWFALLLALSGTAFPLNSSAIYATLELTLIGRLTWVIASTGVIARRSPGVVLPLQRPRRD